MTPIGRSVVFVEGRRRDGHDGSAGRYAMLGFMAGVAIGVVLWSGQQRRHRRGLFSRSPVVRLAALGYLSARPSPSAVRLLRDYVSWEARPVLRRRGIDVLRRMEASLE